MESPIPSQASSAPLAESDALDDLHLPNLTPRQQQILALFRVGKVNKEIASELGIALGTVKQHVVALFKKLQVNNRAMAVSHGLNARLIDSQRKAAPLISDGLLERRPCLVLSVVLPDSAPASAGRLLHQTLAACAFDHDALFLSRKGNAGDLIFGIQPATEDDLFFLLRAADTVFSAFAAQDAALAAGLRGGLTAGLAIASMNRHGGWSGEAVASPAIAHARELACAAKPASLALSLSARDLLQALSPCAPTSAASELYFAALDSLPWRTENDRDLPLGRHAELGRLDALLASAAKGVSRLVYLEGETGMGKSRLCRHVAARCAAHAGTVHHFVCKPNRGNPLVYSLSDHRQSTIDCLLSILASAAVRTEALIVDDCHLLPADVLAQLAKAATQSPGRLVLLAARRLPEMPIVADETLRLGRLTKNAIEQLVLRTLGISEASPLVTTIVGDAAGVPLFAIQLARQHGRGPLPLPLRFVIGARMDSLGLDRVLLRRVAHAPVPLPITELAGDGITDDAVHLALACGLLKCDDQNRLSFTHPLLRRALIEAQVE